MARVLVVCAEPIGPQVAGPAIRALELARVLASSHEVTIAAPAPSETGDPRITLIEAGFADYDELSAAVAASDFVVAQSLPPRLLSKLPSLGTRLIADLYNPTVFEVLEAGRDKPTAARRRQQRTVTLASIAQLAAASFVICASEQQRDLWLGVMAAEGLVQIEDYSRDPTLRSVIDVVPFGLPSQPPVAPTSPPIRSIFPSIAADDRIVLWGGGVWNWLDPETAIDAIGLIEQRRSGGPRTHLVMMGMGRPASEELDAMRAGQRMLGHLTRSGLEGEVVHVNRGWVDYDARGGWLLEADLGVSTHHDHLESRLAFRTRMLDYIWASLPIVATTGDTLSALVEREGLGLTVAPADAAGLAEAISALLDDPARMASAKLSLERLAPKMTWQQAAASLSAICGDELATGSPDRAALRRVTLAQYPPLLAETHATHGLRGAAARALRNLRRTLTPGS
jgi:glycosyltransferase involved in cell wall biosynthesis